MQGLAVEHGQHPTLHEGHDHQGDHLGRVSNIHCGLNGIQIWHQSRLLEGLNLDLGRRILLGRGLGRDPTEGAIDDRASRANARQPEKQQIGPQRALRGRLGFNRGCKVIFNGPPGRGSGTLRRIAKDLAGDVDLGPEMILGRHIRL